MVFGDLPLTAIQHEFFATELPAPHHYNLSVLLSSRGPVDPRALERAITAVIHHHDALRLRFELAPDGSWQAHQCGIETVPVHPLMVLDTTALQEPARVAVVEEVSASIQASLRLDAGCLLRAAWFDLGPALGSRLLLAAHHLVVDGVSWRLLLEDLGHAYEAALAGLPVRLPAKTTSWRTWAHRVREVADNAATTSEVDYWVGVARARSRLPFDHDLSPDQAEAANTLARGDSVQVRLPAELTTALLEDVPGTYATRIDDALLCALAQAPSRRCQLRDSK
jgi:hypothetical protein